MESVWIQIKAGCEMLTEETNATDRHIAKMLLQLAYRYYAEP